MTVTLQTATLQTAGLFPTPPDEVDPAEVAEAFAAYRGPAAGSHGSADEPAIDAPAEPSVELSLATAPLVAVILASLAIGCGYLAHIAPEYGWGFALLPLVLTLPLQWVGGAFVRMNGWRSIIAVGLVGLVGGMLLTPAYYLFDLWAESPLEYQRDPLSLLADLPGYVQHRVETDVLTRHGREQDVSILKNAAYLLFNLVGVPYIVASVMVDKAKKNRQLAHDAGAI